MSGNSCKGEGGDFVQESKNRKTKMFIPTGVPNQQCLNVCRNIDRLEKVRENIVKVLNMTENDEDLSVCL